MAGSETKYKPKYCKKLVDHMSKGYSLETFGHKVGVTRQTVYNWIKQFPDFKKAKDEAQQAAQDFFEQKLMAKLDKSDFSSKYIDTSCLIFALKTRFHKTYSEKQEVSVDLPEIKLNYSKKE